MNVEVNLKVTHLTYKSTMKQKIKLKLGRIQIPGCKSDNCTKPLKELIKILRETV